MVKFTKSKNFSMEYCCTFIKIGEVSPIEGADKLGVTIVNGRNIVVRKDEVKEGDVLIYASNESQLDADFLKTNNLFEDTSMNSDPEKKGYFNKYGRVRMIKLRGVYSMGFLFEPKSLSYLGQFDAESLVGTDFDEVDGKLFVKAYVPAPYPERKHSTVKPRRGAPKYNRLIPNQFTFHYDTKPLERCESMFDLTEDVAISIKMHGTSAVFGQLRVKEPMFGGLYKKYFAYLPSFLQFTKEKYDMIYSSRTVIKNANLNTSVTGGYYGEDVWGVWAKRLAPYIPNDVIVYGEIVGFSESGTAIQKKYDYGCNQRESKFIIYRVTTRRGGIFKEFDMKEVCDFASELSKKVPGVVAPTIVFNGPLTQLYPDAPTMKDKIAKLKNDFGMEQMEPMCKNKVPREGLVLRINGKPEVGAYKLKAVKFLAKEAEQVDKGELDDESTEKYS